MNKNKVQLPVYDFSGEVEDSFYIKDFSVGKSSVMNIEEGDFVHLRVDPPFDMRYLNLCWMLASWEKRGIKALNSPRGVAVFNEKLLAYEHTSSLPTFIGRSSLALREYLEGLSEEEFIFKPLDLYQGMGVEKVKGDIPKLVEYFEARVRKDRAALVVQPFYSGVYKGEVRAVYFRGQELGSLIKIPRQGEFLANIAQGALFEKIELTPKQKMACDEVAQKLMKYGVEWVAYDILGEALSEVNITCPGLLVELSHAHQRNFADDIVEILSR